MAKIIIENLIYLQPLREIKRSQPDEAGTKKVVQTCVAGVERSDPPGDSAISGGSLCSTPATLVQSFLCFLPRAFQVTDPSTGLWFIGLKAKPRQEHYSHGGGTSAANRSQTANPSAPSGTTSSSWANFSSARKTRVSPICLAIQYATRK
uniref:Uncharacterized protein n=1 Tax=Candidatus Kentrum sp. FW TaxID=2126338 RepID=A0A450T769_9GAMM|nr:MAG: hypothetical protein BECKFW1821B_GA0114236_105518 [Candidatus Kentron sp. FW]VFJ62589.1 MAG: hypothetical protein BECKFW1821A_GA0114235_11316 [Candidatus Kentron sp. FW]